MAIFEDSGTLKYKDKAGNLHIMKPRTTSDNIEGLAQLLAEKENSGAAATALENAKAYTDQKVAAIPTPDVSAQITAHNENQDAHPYIRGLIPTKTSQIENDSGYLTQHQDISGKLDKPANDTTAKAGQLLTKTANGQEWQDREKAVFIVTWTSDNKTDKTVAEIKAASDAGKVCFLFGEGLLIPLLDVDDTMATFSRAISLIDKTIDLFKITVQNGNSTTTTIVESQKPIAAGTDYVAPNGDASNVTAEFTAASTRANIETGEKFSELFGKIAKWFADLGSLAFKSTVAKSDLASDYIASGNITKQTLVATETTPTENYAINWVYGN